MRLTRGTLTHRLQYEALGRLETIMADLTALTTAVDQLVTEDASVVAELQRLSALVASGGTVSQADLDALTAKVQGVNTDITNAIAADPPA
jgi:t-SNARE complex subunit (syntaxin)